MYQTAKVIDVINNDIVTVEAVRSSACSACHKNSNDCEICGLIGADKTFRTKAVNLAGASLGDRVRIYTSDSTSLIYAVLIFLMPIISALIFFFIASGFFSAEDNISYICGGIGFICAVAAVILISKAKKTPAVTVTEIIEKAPTNETVN